MKPGDLVFIAPTYVTSADMHYRLGNIDRLIEDKFAVAVGNTIHVLDRSDIICAELTPLLTQALFVATKAHEGQLDKSGDVYIKHPIRVMLSMKTDKERIVAILHDVVEDTAVTIQYIAAWFGEEIAEAVAALTHKRCEPYIVYLSRLKENELALAVKLADVEDNLSRVDSLELGVASRLRKKYTEAKCFLTCQG